MRLLLLSLLLSSQAQALPSERSTEERVDDTLLGLTLLSQAISGDSRSHCFIQLEVGGEGVPFSAGDKIYLWLYEDDFVGDDEIWSQELEISPEELEAQRLERFVDCASGFPQEDSGGEIEIYARAEVEKAECGFWCLYDRPSTSTISLSFVEDDELEENDASGQAQRLPQGLSPDHISRDQDWYLISTLDRSLLSIRVVHRSQNGRLEGDLFDLEGERLSAGGSLPEATLAEAGPLSAGDYLLRVSPRDGQDYNFYDLEIRSIIGGCDPNAQQQTPCERCGWRTRICQEDARWGEYGECERQGECEVGSNRQKGCGNCGIEQQSCSELCFWEQGECINEGECRPEEIFEEACDEARGRRTRRCSELCAWSAWGDCIPHECSPGESRDCYEGPVGTAGFGLCRLGRTHCMEGLWGACEGEVQPNHELCDDGLDNDCDGTTDQGDRDCGGDVDVGDPCKRDEECGGLMICLMEPEVPGFRGGYCSFLDCDGDCPDGSACGETMGLNLCLSRCGRNADCQPGQICADAETDIGGLACIPRCMLSSECRDPALPHCDEESGLCLPPIAPEFDLGVIPDATPTLDRGELSNPDRSAVDQGRNPDALLPHLEEFEEDEADCHCHLGRPSLPPWFWLSLLLPLWALRFPKR